MTSGAGSLHAKVDGNQREIVQALIAAGCSVCSLAAVGKGAPDLLVGHAGRNYLLEVKTLTGRIERGQYEWHAAWRGQACIVRTVEQALEAVGLGMAL